MTTTTKPKRARRFAREPAPKSLTPAPLAESKTAQVIALLQRPDGATLDELIAATGWLPHTTRAALTGLRKKGHAVERKAVEGGASRYMITITSPA